MTLRYVDNAPRTVDLIEPSELGSEHLEQIVEIFETPLEGSYNWDYQSQDGRIRKLYELGKQLNWNAAEDIDWSIEFPRGEKSVTEGMNPFYDYEPYQKMSDQEKGEFGRHLQANQLSQFLHGEQGALLVASQLVSCAPTYDAKLYAASQAFDEARHVEVFNRYINERIKIRYPVQVHLKSIIDKLLTDNRWDLKFIGMQIIIEGLALSAFHNLEKSARDPLLRQILHYVIRDEARHVTFGVSYLEEFVKSLPQEEIEDRAQFAYETCVVMRERLISLDVFEHFGWNVEEARELALQGEYIERFRNLLFSRIMPNLKRIGLLTEKIRPRFDELGVLELENLVCDGDIDWAELAKPLQASA